MDKTVPFRNGIGSGRMTVRVVVWAAAHDAWAELLGEAAAVQVLASGGGGGGGGGGWVERLRLSGGDDDGWRSAHRLTASMSIICTFGSDCLGCVGTVAVQSCADDLPWHGVQIDVELGDAISNGLADNGGVTGRAGLIVRIQYFTY